MDWLLTLILEVIPHEGASRRRRGDGGGGGRGGYTYMRIAGVVWMSVDGSLLNANFIASRALTAVGFVKSNFWCDLLRSEVQPHWECWEYVSVGSHTGSVGSTLVLEPHWEYVSVGRHTGSVGRTQVLWATLGVLRVRWCRKPHWECWEYVPSFRKPYRHRTRHMTGTVCNHQQTLTLPLIPSNDSMHVSGWVGGGGCGW